MICPAVFVVGCPATHFTCSNRTKMYVVITFVTVLTGVMKLLTASVTSVEFECVSDGCVNGTWVCDGEADCF